jgi:hypothetical protein
LIRFSLRGAMLALTVGVGVFLLKGTQTSAQAWQNGDGQQYGQPPVYQRHAFDGHRRDERRDRRDFRRDSRIASPQISAGWFQRPYPYHLDYYKMRYGGSYAPYFGNLYGTPFGTPQVVNYPPYYGPYYDGYGGGYGDGYGQPRYGGAAAEFPISSRTMMPGTAVEEVAPVETQEIEMPAPTP